MAGLRSTMYIGLGGFGSSVVREIKRRIAEVKPDQVDGFGFLALDTQGWSKSDILIKNEYIPMALGVSPQTVSSNDPKFLGWFPKLMGNTGNYTISGGADAKRPVGRLAFRYGKTLAEFISKFSQTSRGLKEERSGFESGMQPKFYVISTLAGGTGSGCLIDVLFVVGKLIKQEIGEGASYQLIAVMPEFLQSKVNMERLGMFRANAYATLKELHHVLTTNEPPTASFDDNFLANISLSKEYLPQAVHIVGDRNEHGTLILKQPEEMIATVSAYLESEIVTPVDVAGGKPRIQDMENQYIDEVGHSNMARCISSIGVTTVGIPKDHIDRLYALMLLEASLEKEIQATVNVYEQTADWLTSERLCETGTNQLQDSIRAALAPELFDTAIDPRGRLLDSGYKREKLAGECQKYSEELDKSIAKERKPEILKQGKLRKQGAILALKGKADSILRTGVHGEVLAFLNQLEHALKSHQASMSEEHKQAQNRLALLEGDVKKAIEGVGDSIQGFWGRTERIVDAISDFGHRKEAELSASIDLWVSEQAAEVFSAIVGECAVLAKDYKSKVEMLKGRLKAIQEEIHAENRQIDALADLNKRGEGNRFSLVDSSRARELYKEKIAPEIGASIGRIRGRWIDSPKLSDSKTTTEDWIQLQSGKIVAEEISAKLADQSFMTVLERFYSKTDDRNSLFDTLNTISSPLFHLDRNKEETAYDDQILFGIHNDLRDEFFTKYERMFEVRGKGHLHFDSKHEIKIYQVVFGYTLHSHSSIVLYERELRQRLQKYFQQKASKKTPGTSFHSWIEAFEWPEILPSKSSEEAASWFVLGRAFSTLFPSEGAASADDKKNTAYLFKRGANFYIQLDDANKPQLIGNGLPAAFAEFSDRLDWQSVLREKITRKRNEIGERTLADRLVKEFVPLISSEIETAENNPDGNSAERARILRKMLVALEQYLKSELTTATF